MVYDSAGTMDKQWYIQHLINILYMIDSLMFTALIKVSSVPFLFIALPHSSFYGFLAISIGIYFNSKIRAGFFRG